MLYIRQWCNGEAPFPPANSSSGFKFQILQRIAKPLRQTLNPLNPAHHLAMRGVYVTPLTSGMDSYDSRTTIWKRRMPENCTFFTLVKSLVYADKPQTLDHLEDTIRRVIADIRPQMFEKVIENWTSRLDYIRASRGSPMPEIMFKM
ncbi:hypothetical protein TNCV_1729961 [Trichonephila clavipes]|nr:hypothetical protein TNCV_1729961 [Trichonephila clavipes]